MTVLENLMFSGSSIKNDSFFQSILNTSSSKKYESDLEERAFEIMQDLNIEKMSESYARELSGGQKKLLELGRSLMKNPDLLLLDEPLAGVNPKLAEEIFLTLYKNLSDRRDNIFLWLNITLNAVMKISERVVVHGRRKELLQMVHR